MRIKYQQGLDLFLLAKSATCSDRTMEYYTSCLRYFTDFIIMELKKEIHDIYLDEISLKNLNGFVVYLRTKKKYEGNIFVSEQRKASEKLKKKSVQTYQRGIKIFFSYCYDENLMDVEITRKYKLIKGETSIIVPLYNHEVEEIDKIYNPKTETGIRNLAIVHLLLDAGFRSGEVLSLKICDIMFDKNLVMADGKGDKQRIIPMGKKLKNYLYKYLIMYRRVSINQMGNFTNYNDDYVFLNLKNSQSIGDNVITMMFSRIKKRTGIERVHPHLLRHTFATSYVLMGGDLESLRIYLGHADVQTTTMYTHLANTYKLMNEDIYKLDSVFLSAGIISGTNN